MSQISVIIPTYNRANLLKEGISSVLKQTYQNFELIIVDDGSLDNTEKIVKGFKDQRIVYLKHEKNRGVAASCNTGVKKAVGKYVFILNAGCGKNLISGAIPKTFTLHSEVKYVFISFDGLHLQACPEPVEGVASILGRKIPKNFCSGT